MTSWITIASASPIPDESVPMLQEWQRQRLIEPPADSTWLEIGCWSEGREHSGEPDLFVLAPACGVSAGDRLEIEEAQPLGISFQTESEDGFGPRFLATTMVEHEDGWQARCAPITEGTELFTLGTVGLEVAEVFRALIPGSGVLLWGNAAQAALGAMSSDLGLAARAAIPALRTADFALWIARGLPPQISHARRAGRDVECAWTESRTLIWRDGVLVPIVVPFDDPPKFDPSALPPVDYFAATRDGVEAIRLERSDRLPEEALRLIVTQRPRGTISLRVDERDRLVVGAGQEETTIDGPGFTTHLGHRNVVLSVPYVAALALYSSAGRRPVAVWADAYWGIVLHEDMMAQLVWSTAAPQPG